MWYGADLSLKERNASPVELAAMNPETEMVCASYWLTESFKSDSKFSFTVKTLKKKKKSLHFARILKSFPSSKRFRSQLWTLALLGNTQLVCFRIIISFFQKFVCSIFYVYQVYDYLHARMAALENTFKLWVCRYTKGLYEPMYALSDLHFSKLLQEKDYRYVSEGNRHYGNVRTHCFPKLIFGKMFLPVADKGRSY